MTKAQPFEVLSTLAGGIELRHYPAHTVISVDVSADFESAGGIAFGPLVSYISGANTTGQKMAMTAPVVQAPHADSHTISFVLPEGTDPHAAPLPVDGRVSVGQVAPREVAALRFSGSWRKDRVMQKTQLLLEGLATQGIKVSGDVFYGRFDSPAVPGFLRHNEALVEVANLHP